ncbi:protein YgfX [Rheinheimera sp.]|uniref:protein YgfX n=1 Tax=Rheinheimera sp. TaxID=1869214 RepID=UPI0027B90821|nr:protein YgfX [Rheinheimera sp.]
MSGASAFSLALRPSRWRALPYALSVLGIVCVCLLLPLLWWQLLILSPVVILCLYWQLQLWFQPLSIQMLTLDTAGRIRFLHDVKPAGQLLPQSLVSGWGFWLYWRDDNAVVHQLWLYRDNFSPADGSALARACTERRWQLQS